MARRLRSKTCSPALRELTVWNHPSIHIWESERPSRTSSSEVPTNIISWKKFVVVTAMKRAMVWMRE